MSNIKQAEIARIAGEAGAKIALERFEKEVRKSKRESIDRRLRNTKLLLRNYRTLMDHCKSAIFDIKQMDEEATTLDILCALDDPLYDDDMYIESIKRTAERTHIMMSHVNEMLRLYEIYCIESPRPEDLRRYKTLHALYVDKEEKTIRQIADEQYIDTRTVYRDVDAAVEKISALLFGIYGIHVSQ